jgi:hypothetical protein
VVDLRAIDTVRIYADIGGSLDTATKIRIQYHPGGDPTVDTADVGWAELATTAGSHWLSTAFFSAAIAIPEAAKVNNCVIRPVLYGGDGVADPTIRSCHLTFYR